MSKYQLLIGLYILRGSIQLSFSRDQSWGLLFNVFITVTLGKGVCSWNEQVSSNYLSGLSNRKQMGFCAGRTRRLQELEWDQWKRINVNITKSVKLHDEGQVCFICSSIGTTGKGIFQNLDHHKMIMGSIGSNVIANIY